MKNEQESLYRNFANTLVVIGSKILTLTRQRLFSKNILAREGADWWINLDGKGGAVKGSALRSSPCRQSSVCPAGTFRKRSVEHSSCASEKSLLDIRYFDGSRLDGDSRG